jgi:hypothetical protein
MKLSAKVTMCATSFIKVEIPKFCINDTAPTFCIEDVDLPCFEKEEARCWCTFGAKGPTI